MKTAMYFALVALAVIALAVALSIFVELHFAPSWMEVQP